MTHGSTWFPIIGPNYLAPPTKAARRNLRNKARKKTLAERRRKQGRNRVAGSTERHGQGTNPRNQPSLQSPILSCSNGNTFKVPTDRLRLVLCNFRSFSW